MGRRGLRVNTIAPGSIASSGLDTYDTKDTDFIRNQVAPESLAALWTRGGGPRGGGVPAVTGGQLHHRDLPPCRRWRPNAKPGWWELQPVQHNIPFDGFHRSALPAILDANLPN